LHTSKTWHLCGTRDLCGNFLSINVSYTVPHRWIEAVQYHIGALLAKRDPPQKKEKEHGRQNDPTGNDQKNCRKNRNCPEVRQGSGGGHRRPGAVRAPGRPRSQDHPPGDFQASHPGGPDLQRPANRQARQEAGHHHRQVQGHRGSQAGLQRIVRKSLFIKGRGCPPAFNNHPPLKCPRKIM
jgi:hypothetical protein